MTDNLNKRGKADRIRINVHQSYERAYWAKALHTTQGDLRALVAKHGVMVKDIKRAMIERIKAA